MKLARPELAFRDSRGEIIDILTKTTVDDITVITSSLGAVRGNHYHRETVQWVYILDGRLKLLSQRPDGPVVAEVLEAGDLAVSEPLERHAMVALADTRFIVFTRGPRGGQAYESDTYRLTEPLRERPGQP